MFPYNPNVGQIFESHGARFWWDGIAWSRLDTEVKVSTRLYRPPGKPAQCNAHVIRWRAVQRKADRIAFNEAHQYKGLTAR